MENQTNYIRVCEFEGQDSVDIQLELDGSLSAATLRAYFPGVTGLKFRPGIFSPYRAVELLNDGKFRAPGGSWGIGEFVCVTSGGQKRKCDDYVTTEICKRFKESRRDINDTFGIPETDMSTFYLPNNADEVIGESINFLEPINSSTQELEENNYNDIYSEFQSLIEEPANEPVLRDNVRNFFSNYMSTQSQDDEFENIMTTASDPDAAFDYSAMQSFMVSQPDVYDHLDNSGTDVPTYYMIDGAYEVIGKAIQPIHSNTPETEDNRYMEIFQSLLQEPANVQVLRDIVRVFFLNNSSEQSLNDQTQEIVTNASIPDCVSDDAINRDALRSFIDNYLDVNEYFDDPETDMPSIDTTENAIQTGTDTQLPQQIYSGAPEFEDDIFLDVVIEVKYAPVNRDV